MMFGLVPFDRRRNQMQSADRNQEWNIDKLFENFFNDTIFPTYYTRSGFMKVDIGETDQAYWLEAELPGVDKDQVQIDLNDGQLTISVEQNEESEVKDEKYLRKERHCCSMKRSFVLDNIDEEKIAAKLENGVLRLDLPKKEQQKTITRKIDIK